MESIVRNFNTDENFWETNPSFKLIKEFKEFHDTDKSKGKGKSSQLMWAIAFLVDPHEHNIWKNLIEEDKKMLIQDDFLKKKDFDWEEYQPLIDTYYNLVLTTPEKDYLELISKMTERKQFIKDTPYTLDNAKILDDMVLKTAKLYEELEVVKQKLAQSKDIDGETKGGMQESATEKGLL